MNARQLKKFNMMLTVLHVCKDNIAIISMVPAMVKALDEFDNSIKEIVELLIWQQKPITVHAKMKKEVRHQLAEHLCKLMPLARSYASIYKNPVLYHQMDYTYSDLYRLAAIRLEGKAGAICNCMRDNLDALKEVNIKKEHVITLQKLINRFRELGPEPRVAQSNRISATKCLKDKINETDLILKDSLDGLLPALIEYPHFTKTYFRARRLISYGRPKQVLKNKIKQFQSAPEIPKKYLRKANKFKSVAVVLRESDSD